jgi:long-chain fatty acid transport protein
MKSAKIISFIAVTLTGLVFVSQSVQAGGLDLYEISTPDVGLASAGSAAGAQDASTIFKNPAGMSLLDGPQLNSTLQALYGNVKFSGNSKTLPGGNGDNAIGALPGASLFVAYPVTKKLTLGFGTFSYFGLAEDYGNSWSGRYYVQKATLLGMSLMPAASFKVNDWLSVGGGLNAMYGYLDAQTAVNNLLPGVPDGQMTIKNHVWGFGGNAGIMIQPVEGTRIGVNYLSQVDLNFSAKPGFTGLGPGLGAALANPPQLDLGMTVPQAVMVGVYQEINTNWAVMADVGWQQWSKFGEVAVGVNTANPANSKDLTTQLNYDDTWHGAIGAQYRASEQWRFTGGFAYDTSAVSDANRTVTVPMGAAYRMGVGAFWKVSQTVDLGAAYELAWSGNLPVTQGTSGSYRGEVSGSYNNACFNFFSVNLNWRF